MHRPGKALQKTLLCKAGFLAALFHSSTVTAAADSQGVVTFNTPVARPTHLSRIINYSLDPRCARFFVYTPAQYDKSKPSGLIVYISDINHEKLPEDWQPVLESHKMLFVMPQGVGNRVRMDVRYGAAVLGALEMMQHYNIDKNRVYAAGFSGGARIASYLAMVHSEIFRGAILVCGCDYYRKVQQVQATEVIDSTGHEYGVEPANVVEVAGARARTGFVLITGKRDFRRGNILDIYNGGFARDGFRAKLIDIPEMGHKECDGKTLDEALTFLE